MHQNLYLIKPFWYLTNYFYDFLIYWLTNNGLLDEILRVEGLSKQFVKKNVFGSTKSLVKAVEDVSFSLYNDEEIGRASCRERV